MIQLCSKDKEKVYQVIHSGNIDAADMALPNLIDDIVLTMKKQGLLDMLSYALPDKRRDNHHIPLDILLALAVTAKLKISITSTNRCAGRIVVGIRHAFPAFLSAIFVKCPRIGKIPPACDCRIHNLVNVVNLPAFRLIIFMVQCFPVKLFGAHLSKH